MSVFEYLDVRVSAALASVFAEPAHLHPRLSAQYAERAVDPDRAEVTVHGIFSAGPGQDDLRGQARGGQMSGTTKLGSTAAEFWIARAQVDALTTMPAKGDMITLTSRAGSPIYAISGVHHTDMGDLNLILVREDDVS
ncbi:hypothetical protein [Tateyamaria pelophila]|uniref:hypothetical protein n=1 Tax=Tateyamaria pelophila TaxID=328415 RepID=UPI001CC03B1F|nr:hypothetical protein [Tateyamaria pelophila]